MTAPTHQTLFVPRERAQQLHGLMDGAGARTVSEMMGKLFAAYAAQGHVPTDLPGVTVNRLSDGVAVRIGDNARHGLTLEGARLLAETIRALATGERSQGAVNMDGDWAVTRKGQGVRVTVPFVGGQPKGYALDLALELAELIERAAT